MLRLACMLAAAACSEGTPVAPEPVTVAVVLDYLQPRIPGPPPPPLLPELTGCLHHFAPAQLQIATSWGATARLTPRGDRVFAALLLNVPAPPEHRWPELRLTLDTWEDYRVIRAIFDALFPANPDFGLTQILDWLRAHPQWVMVNHDVRQKPVRAS